MTPQEQPDSQAKEMCDCGFPQSSPIPHRHSLPDSRAGDEQTETDKLFNDIEAAINRQNGWSREAVRPLVAAWSRQQTARVLDKLLEGKTVLYNFNEIPVIAVEASAIAALRVGLE